MKKVLNLGCGTSPLRNTATRAYINMDAIMLPKMTDVTYIQGDITKDLPNIQLGVFDEIYLFHCIEHIPEENHRKLLVSIRSLLKTPGGRFAISYPEFKKCARNYITNHKGMRDFWKATIYGRGLTEWDRHKALMDSDLFVMTLKECGLEPISVKPERREDFNTVIICRPVDVRPSYEEVLKTIA